MSVCQGATSRQLTYCNPSNIAAHGLHWHDSSLRIFFPISNPKDQSQRFDIQHYKKEKMSHLLIYPLKPSIWATLLCPMTL